MRQLESMIRLSEAIAKANCVDDVGEEFVREAWNLLRQSIISVEKDDVDVDDEDEADDGVDGARDADSPMAEDGDEEVVNGEPQQQQQRQAKTKITYDRYMAILNLLVRKINTEESSTGEGMEHEELVLWYLESKEEEFDTQEEVERERELVGKVLRRMVKVRFLTFPLASSRCF